MEGKKTVNQQKGLDEMKLFDGIENALINTNYPKHTVIRSLILFGEKKDNIHEDVGFWLDNLGNINLQSKTPRIIKDSFENLINYV